MGDQDPHWKPSTVATVRSILTACPNWAVEQGIIDASPLARLKPGRDRRDRILTADERKRIMDAVTPHLRDFLEALALTGGRPFGEVAGLTADMIDWEAGTIPIRVHKNARRGKTRTIYLSPPLIALLRRKAGEHPAPEKAPLYQHQLEALVTDWRLRWGEELPFAWVQLPNFERPGDGWSLVREGMLKALRLPKTGMAITVDVGRNRRAGTGTNRIDGAATAKQSSHWSSGARRHRE